MAFRFQATYGPRAEHGIFDPFSGLQNLLQYDTGEEIKWKELVRLVHLQLHNDVDMHFRWEINLGQDWRGFMFRSGIEGR
ncbi:hypothetical protein N7507_008421 [Penicillium longicatenatum]|nr:hypothetical protein N7507_008421 [Penicillium longicatenatum]